MDPRYELRRRLRDLRWTRERADELGLAYAGPADFVLSEGRWWPVESGLPPGVPMYGAPRACFGNCIYAATVWDLRYVQGYALGLDNDGTLAAIPHAWVADASGRAWDLTWRPPGWAYLGVEFSVERADDATWNGDAETIDDRERGWPLLREPWGRECEPDPAWPPSPSLIAARLMRDGDVEKARRVWETALFDLDRRSE